MINKDNEKYLFSRAIILVVLSYILIQCINNYPYFLTLLQKGIKILKPFIVAFVIAYLLHPIVKFLEKVLQNSRVFCISLVYLSLTALIIIAIYFVYPGVARSISQLFKDFPTYISQIGSLSDTITSHSDSTLASVINGISSEFEIFIKTNFSAYLSSAVGTTISFASILFNSFISLAAAFYILLEKESIFKVASAIFIKLFGKKHYTSVNSLLKSLHTNIGRYLIGKGTNSVFIAVFSFIGLSILKSKYVALLSIFLGLTNMIPFLGPLIGSSIAALLNVFSNPLTALLIIVYLFIIQQIESFILEPKLIGKQLGLTPFLTLFSVSVGGSLFGILGMVLGVPVMSLIKSTIKPLLEDTSL